MGHFWKTKKKMVVVKLVQQGDRCHAMDDAAAKDWNDYILTAVTEYVT